MNLQMSREQNSSDILPNSDSDSEESASTPPSNCGDGSVKKMSLGLLFALVHTARLIDTPTMIKIVEE